MKFSLPLVVIALATAIDAVALPEADPQWCLFPGEPCKREALPDPQWCLFPGEPCKREPEPNWCLFRGEPCKKRAARALSAFAEAVNSGHPIVKSREVEFSNMPGNAAYMAKRQLDSLATVMASTRSVPEEWYHSLNLASRFAPDIPEDGALVARDSAEQDKRWCNSEGQACWTVKRAAEAVVEALGGRGVVSEDLPFHPFAQAKREPEPNWCLFRGEPCKRDEWSLEARCNQPNGLCTATKRDLHAMYNAARDILETAD